MRFDFNILNSWFIVQSFYRILVTTKKTSWKIAIANVVVLLKQFPDHGHEVQNVARKGWNSTFVLIKKYLSHQLTTCQL